MQINNEQADLYDDTGKHFITISTTKLKWLWQQYNKASYSSHSLVSQTQSFQKEVIWLYKKYKHEAPRKNPLKTT